MDITLYTASDTIKDGDAAKDPEATKLKEKEGGATVAKQGEWKGGYEWVMKTWKSCEEELRSAIGSVGFRAFADSISDLLDREKAWVSLISL